MGPPPNNAAVSAGEMPHPLVFARLSGYGTGLMNQAGP